MTGSDEAGGFVLPVGTVAFLLTDVAGSTRAWEAEPDAMAKAMDRHNSILDAAVSTHGGVCPPAQGEGDSVVAAFARASDAVLAATAAQLALVRESWPTSDPLRVRMAVHAGEARVVDGGNYAGQAIIRTARLREVAHGGQVLVSAPARDLTIDHLGDGVQLRDLGEHRLRDLARPERVYQLEGPGLPTEFPPIASLGARPHNLPIQLSSFIGRAEEVATVAGLLAAHRLVTIAGAGGAGKTRLSQHVAAEVLDRFADGVWWVELAEISDPTVVPATISAVMGVKGEVDDAAATALAERLGDRAALLVLDNCEHLVGPVAFLVDEVLRRCPGMRVLATSREPLEVAGEVAWRIPPLGIPATSEVIPIGGLPQYESVRLFVERARGVRPNFKLNDDTGPAVAAICTRLDGIPLAIELAAARCRSLSPERILSGLEDAFHLLNSGGRTALPRQQTLEASIAWSHDLLGDDEQILLRRLAVFNGGWTLDDAEAIVADELLEAPAVLDVLDRLIAQSLVNHDDSDVVPRYRLLETVRQYAARRLRDADEHDTFSERHADRFIALARRIGDAVEGGDDWPAYAVATAERYNFAVALGTLAAAGHWDGFADLAVGISWARMVTEPLQSIRDLGTALVHVAPTSAVAARVLAARAFTASLMLDPTVTTADASTCIDIAGAIGDDRSAGRAKIALGNLLGYVNPTLGDALLSEAIDQLSLAGDEYGRVVASGFRASAVLAFRGDSKAGWPLMERALADAAELGDQNIIGGFNSYAAVGLCVQGRYTEARTHLAVAERALRGLAAATRLPLDYLARNSHLGNGCLFVRSYLRTAAQQEDDLDLEELESTVEIGRREGQGFVSIAVGLSVAMARLASGDTDRALREFQAVTVHATEAGATFFVVMADTFTAVALDELGEHAAARELAARTEPAARACESLFAVARYDCWVGAFALSDGDLAEAERRAHACLTTATEHALAWEMIIGLELLAAIEEAGGSPTQAVRLAAAAARGRDERELRFRLGDRSAAALERCRAALTDDDFDAAWADGLALSLEQAAAYAQRARGERKRPAVGWDSLTPTELLVVEQVQQGLTNPEIAAALFMSRDTVKTHLAHTFAKLGVKSRSEVAAIAARRAT